MDLIKKYLMQNIDTLLDSIDEAILIVDHSGNILKYNKAFSHLTDLNGRSYIGKNIYEIVESGLLRESAALKSLEVKKKIDMNLTYETGQTATWTYIPVFDEEGKLVLTIGTGRDITKIMTLEKKLKISETIISQYEGMKLTDTGDFGTTAMISSSSSMQQVIRMAWKAAATSSPVLIWGETGVGKEVVASFIHQTSDRSLKPFVVINCASIPDELLEAELFGYEEGSFTGARKSGKKGLLEEAHGGTLFLDEIGELPLKMQSKLLRFLQEGTFKRIGSNKMQSVDVRILSATNLTVDKLMSGHHFRQDLFYRINVVPIFVPPLRERRDDIFPLISHFTKFFNQRYSTEIRVPARLVTRLYNYDWPGNVRELKNVIERIAILYAAQELSEEDLELVLSVRPPDAKTYPAIQPGEGPLPAINAQTMKSAMDRFEADLIRQACKSSGSIVKAAKALGVNPSTIHRKLKRAAIGLG